jgi:beta-ribofuranosylaminobenzene 5'-phosphate synthase
VQTRVEACARLHFGLFNLSGLHGRVDGGAGIAVAHPTCSISVRDGTDTVISQKPLSAQMAHSVARAISSFRSKFGLPGCEIEILQGIPEHAGLGSKTACMMALGRALSAHFGLDLDYVDIAGLVGRGGTSGVGVHASEHGGIVIDEGHDFPGEKQTFVPSSASGAWPPPLRARETAPSGCAVVHLRFDAHGLSGAAEKRFFGENCPVPDEETQDLLDTVEQILLPGVQNASLAHINEALGRLQQLGLKAREWDIQSAATRSLRDRWEELRCQRRRDSLPPLCLSSMGPTVFVLTDDAGRATDELSRLGVPADAVSVTAPTATGNLITQAC